MKKMLLRALLSEGSVPAQQDNNNQVEAATVKNNDGAIIHVQQPEQCSAEDSYMASLVKIIEPQKGAEVEPERALADMSAYTMTSGTAPTHEPSAAELKQALKRCEKQAKSPSNSSLLAPNERKLPKPIVLSAQEISSTSVPLTEQKAPNKDTKLSGRRGRLNRNPDYEWRIKTEADFDKEKQKQNAAKQNHPNMSAAGERTKPNSSTTGLAEFDSEFDYIHGYRLDVSDPRLDLDLLADRIGDCLDENLYMAYSIYPQLEDPLHLNVAWLWVPNQADLRESQLSKVQLTALLDEDNTLTRVDYPIRVSRYCFLAGVGEPPGAESFMSESANAEKSILTSASSYEQSLNIAMAEISEGLYQECPDYESYMQDLLDAEFTIVRNVLHHYRPADPREQRVCSNIEALYERRWQRETVDRILQKIGSDAIHNRSPVDFLVSHMRLVFFLCGLECLALEDELTISLSDELFRIQNDIVEARNIVEEAKLQQKMAEFKAGKAVKLSSEADQKTRSVSKTVATDEALDLTCYGPFKPPESIAQAREARDCRT